MVAGCYPFAFAVNSEICEVRLCGFRQIECYANKNKTMKEKIKTWLYEFWNGHPFLLEEEVEIICRMRFDEKYKWMDDYQIQRLIKFRIKIMYKEKFPKAKCCNLFPI